MEPKTCCVTGGRNIAGKELAEIESALQSEIQQAIKDGYTHFVSGFAKGVDLLFAASVAEMMTKDPPLTLEAAIPYRSRMNTKDELFWRLIGKCSIIRFCGDEYKPGCYKKLDREMVSLSQRVIVVCDARKKSAAHLTMHCAYIQGREVRVVWSRGVK